MEKATLCAINGLALGGGLELAMACDFRICSATAQMGQPEINLGIMPGFGGTQRLPRLIGMARAKQMLLTGNSIDAQRAYDYGLVNQVTPPEETLSVTLEIAKKIASKSLSALHYIQTCLNKGQHMSFSEALQLEATSFGVIFGTEDKTEGIQAFLEKRPPQFKGC
jgi:enoyl-CoA hydratase